jgi:CBS domain-containing protein
MQVQQLMSQPAIVCHAQDTLNQAAHLMWNHDIGAVAVVNDQESLVGIITDRDICMAAYTQGRPIQDIAVCEIMSKQVIACAPGDKVKTAEKKMRAHQIRRLPVVGPDGRVQGMLSLNDIAREAHREGDRRSPEVTPAEVARTLACVCLPREHREMVSAA